MVIGQDRSPVSLKGVPRHKLGVFLPRFQSNKEVLIKTSLSSVLSSWHTTVSLLIFKIFINIYLLTASSSPKNDLMSLCKALFSPIVNVLNPCMLFTFWIHKWEFLRFLLVCNATDCLHFRALTTLAELATTNYLDLYSECL